MSRLCPIQGIHFKRIVLYLLTGYVSCVVVGLTGVYKGKGILFEGEKIRRKAGKAVVK